MTPAQAMAIRLTAAAAFRDAAERVRGRTGALRRLQIRAMRDALVTYDAARPVSAAPEFSLADLERAQAGALPIDLPADVARMREEAAAAGLELERFEQVEDRSGAFMLRPIWRRRAPACRCAQYLGDDPDCPHHGL